METNTSLVSVVIPVYNREDTIIRCIDSALSQTYNEIEVIVVDDNSSDATVDEIESTYSDRIELLRHDENRGGSAARNTGIDASKGEYIAFLDSDDVWKPTKIEHQIKVLQSRDASFVGSYTNAEYISKNTITSIIKNAVTGDFLRNDCTIGGILSLKDKIGGASTLLVRSSVVNEIGGFDPEFDRHQDYEFLIRVLSQGKMLHIPSPYVVKFETNYANAESVEDAKELFFRKFSSTISEYENQDYPITKYHNFDLARCHLRNGSLIKSLHFLIHSRPPTNTDLFSFLKAGLDRASSVLPKLKFLN